MTVLSMKTCLKENWQQFALLALINAFVGGMVGLERTVLPLVGTEEFGFALNTVATSFIITFGVTKGLINLISGVFADRYGRKPLLVLGWVIGLPVPFMLMYGDWNTILFANVLLGINQGLTWSMAVIMKIDLVGAKQRGLAVGLNEFTGYFAVGATALLTGYLGTVYGLRPVPFYPGVVYVVLGLLLSIFLVKDTWRFTRGATQAAPKLPFWEIFKETSWKNKKLFAASQAGMVNNLNDGMAWGIFPLFFASLGLGLEAIGVLKFVYPLIWSVLQVVTGPLSDRMGRKPLIVWGMTLQAVGIILTILVPNYPGWFASTVLLGIGTAMVYPTLIAVVSDEAKPEYRARSLGVYRFWRDMGYAIGALLAGVLADVLGFHWAIGIIAFLTLFSGLLVRFIRFSGSTAGR